MSQRAKQRGKRRVEKGFSLLEVLVVILILGVLAAMAIALNEIVRRAELHFSRWHSE